ncbi:MAG: DUF4190 domain-containing protein [Anaerolineaceae bacterium]|nr:DUF4190 domain-containing protein [Anaerolineaceae bacterium]
MSENTPVEFPEVEMPPMPEGSYSSESTTNGDPSKDWMAIVSLVSGILSLCTAFIPLVCCIAPVFTIAAVVLGILGLKSTKKTLAIIGIVIGGLGIIAQIIMTIIGFVGGASQGFLDEFQYQMDTW